MGRTLVKGVFQGRETMGVGYVGVEGSDINSKHDIFGGGEKHGERLNDLKELLVSLIYKGRNLTMG